MSALRNIMYQTRRNKFIIALMVALALTVNSMAFASGELNIDFDVLFTQINFWIGQFLPILAIGIGIAVAIAVITFVGNRIVDAFKG